MDTRDFAALNRRDAPVATIALGGSLEQHAEQRFQQLFQRHHGQ
jgi:hypothetical protein